MLAKPAAASADWNSTVTALSPWAWLKLDDATTGLVAADASGNGRNGSYPNGNFGGGSHPVRHSPALVNGSAWGIITGGGGNTELSGPGYGDAFGGSWTFGSILKSTSTTGAPYLMRGTGSGVQAFYLSLGLNFDFGDFVAEAGTISLTFDTTGSQPNGLVAAGTGWNDGNEHLLLAEYDSGGDSLSIWLDGAEIATKARAGAKPNLAGKGFDFLNSNPIAGMGVDEVLVFNKTLSGTEHADLAAHLA